MAEIIILFENSLKNAIRKLCSKFGWFTIIESLWNRVSKLATWLLEEEDNDDDAEDKLYTAQNGNFHKSIILEPLLILRRFKRYSV